MDTRGLQTNLSDLLVLAKNIETKLEDPTWAGPDRGEDLDALMHDGKMLLDYATRIRKQIGSLSINDLRQRVADTGG